MTITEVSWVVVINNSQGKKSQEFSLRRTLLTHGTELEVGNQGHFSLDTWKMSTLLPDLQQKTTYLGHLPT